MTTFNDNRGRTWQLKITRRSSWRVSKRNGVNLFRMHEPHRWESLTPQKLVEVLYTLCEPQIVAANVTPEDFGAALFGDAMFSAIDAFKAECARVMPAGIRELAMAAAKG